MYVLDLQGFITQLLLENFKPKQKSRLLARRSYLHETMYP
ncbi:hypothetical protein SAMN06265367_102607 [Algoriphagus winogradskyi]|uniref:Uncharacterized protein n=1 Tax=Algoriphagus winogradskyi TaxID=237017 RepID=A0ABY1NT90_9BACT|nr:hypothetical protein SAMN06265367_102607 [Algoriphagus winogradskyi]